MEKIDLTKCNNLRYKAKIDGIVTTGIVSAKDGINAFLKNEQGYNVGCLTGAGLVDSDNRPITDFEIVPRDPETYQDWQVGDKIIRKGDVCTVVLRCGEVVLFKYKETDGSRCCTCPYICEELFRNGYRLVLTDIEKQIIEDRKKTELSTARTLWGKPFDGTGKIWKPQYGDICFAETEDRAHKFIIIFENASYSLADFYGSGWKLSGGFSWAYSRIRPATDEEKQKLFDALAKQGKRWNAERKVVEDIPKPHEFKEGEPVLVRDNSDGTWRLKAFVEVNEDSLYPYRAENGTLRGMYRHCIPYNDRTMHLLGTTEDYKEE